jgi:hypothetical protein
MQTDDLWFPDHLDRLVGAILGDGADVAYSRPVHVLADGTLFQHPYDLRRPHYREMLLRGDNRIPRSNIYVPVPTALSFGASLRPRAFRDREAHEQQAYYQQMTGDPRWVDRLRGRLAEDLERRFMDQEVELAARLTVINRRGRRPRPRPRPISRAADPTRLSAFAVRPE